MPTKVLRYLANTLSFIYLTGWVSVYIKIISRWQVWGGGGYVNIDESRVWGGGAFLRSSHRSILTMYTWVDTQWGFGDLSGTRSTLVRTEDFKAGVFCNRGSKLHSYVLDKATRALQTNWDSVYPHCLAWSRWNIVLGSPLEVAGLFFSILWYSWSGDHQ
jgi:hypothetical protein